MKSSGDLARFASFDMPLATKLLYGGLTEELLTRWGLMSLVAAGLAAVFGRGRGWILPAAIGVAALGFAAAHLPLLYLINAQPPTWVVAAVLLGNALPGVGFGWLFWKRGLEAAMLAHIVAHAVSTFAIAALATI